MSKRTVLITGATGGLGPTVARCFADDGAVLALNGTDEGRLRALASDIGLLPDAWLPVVADLRDRDAVRDAIAAAEDTLGPIDVLLHLVGGWSGGTAILDLEPEAFEDMLGRHLWTTLHVVQAVGAGMIERGWGRILAVSSPVAAEPPAKSAPYAIGKGAQELLLRSLARETANTGVTVNLVVVKAIDVRGERSTDPKKSSWATPDEIAATLLFLASDDAAAITGARIPLFGR